MKLINKKRIIDLPLYPQKFLGWRAQHYVCRVQKDLPWPLSAFGGISNWGGGWYGTILMEKSTLLHKTLFSRCVLWYDQECSLLALILKDILYQMLRNALQIGNLSNLFCNNIENIESIDVYTNITVLLT